jgi:hypothetical protein
LQGKTNPLLRVGFLQIIRYDSLVCKMHDIIQHIPILLTYEGHKQLNEIYSIGPLTLASVVSSCSDDGGFGP